LISSDIKPDVTLYDKSYCRKYERYANTKLGKEIMDFRLDCVSNAYTHTTLLDFGCGTGEFHRSYDGEGFDINPFSEYCDVSPLLYSHMIVTFWDSIEHLKDPVRIIKGLNPKFIFISTPCYDDFVNGGDIHNITGWHHYYPGEHVHYFNEVSLRALLHKCGYNVFYKSFQESEYRQSGGDKNIITIGGRRG
tara:strand:- start:1051 stop:1626 length:576 start_codon:yes stop_codon:yes gene_type:complete